MLFYEWKQKQTKKHYSFKLFSHVRKLTRFNRDFDDYDSCKKLLENAKFAFNENLSCPHVAWLLKKCTIMLSIFLKSFAAIKEYYFAAYSATHVVIWFITWVINYL